MLFLQGERDYQVTVAADLAGWRTALADRPRVTIRTYPAVDHMFFPGEGLSLPADYTRPHNVDVQVIDDIADWVVAQ
ncbi:hypothetical protein AB0F65_01280 [Nocardia rhamnosiphila]|uniref:hypothetical protein n=1 Tax=Nocardia rhamnosiphila TaxID=426716 RepID=UPI0033D71B56